jgi:hypothetical protein
MMWPEGWRETTLRASGVPVTQFALDVLSAWRQSTPVIPQTLNPVGMPWKGTTYPSWLGTPYALFPGVTAFSDEFRRFTRTPRGNRVLHALISADSLSETWRAIADLPWPAAATETEYPAVLLDMLEQSYRDSVAGRPKGRRRTTGIVQAPADVHTAMRHQSRLLHYAASNMSDASKAIAHIMRGTA